MKITEVQAITLRCKCEPIHDALSTSASRQAVLVKITTDTGLSGIGEAFTYGAPMTVMKYLIERQMGPMLLEADPANIEELFELIYWRTIASGRRSMTLGALSGIDIALWDLRGKMEGKTVAALLGQCSDRVPSYASGGFYAPGKGLDGLRKEVEGYLAKGYRDVKIKIGRNPDRPGPLKYMADQTDAVTVEEDWKRMELVKGLLGSGTFLVDTNASWTAEEVIRNAPALKRLGVSWIEEPVPFEDMEGYRRIVKGLKDIKVIGCETQQGVRNFENMLTFEAIDIVQPDVGWAGGITSVKKIGKLAETCGKAISLHCFGSAVLFAASLQTAAAMPNTVMMESEENPNPLKECLAKGRFETDERMSFFVPDKPGIGIELDWDAVQKYAVEV